MPRILARATVNLPGLHAGRTAYIDPARPYEQMCLAAEFLIPVEEDSDGEASRPVQASADAVPSGK